MNHNLLPNFFILGAAKAGTTSLFQYLQFHPQIYLPLIKETHFFDKDENFCKGLNWYLDTFFNNSQFYFARGEATPAYLRKSDVVAPRMSSVYKDASPKFIVILRDPVERAWSHYLHAKRLALETENFRNALRLEKTRQSDNKNSWLSYFSDGQYAKQLNNWFEYFKKNRFCFLLLDDLRAKPQETLKTVFGFLGVESSIKLKMNIKANVASRPKSEQLMNFLGRPSSVKKVLKRVLPHSILKRVKKELIKINIKTFDETIELDPEIMAMLRDAYESDILELEEIINRDLSGWLLSEPEIKHT